MIKVVKENIFMDLKNNSYFKRIGLSKCAEFYLIDKVNIKV